MKVVVSAPGPYDIVREKCPHGESLRSQELLLWLPGRFVQVNLSCGTTHATLNALLAFL